VAVCALLRREARAAEPAADWATRQSDGRAVDVHLDVDHAPQLLAYSVRFGPNWTRDYRALASGRKHSRRRASGGRLVSICGHLVGRWKTAPSITALLALALAGLRCAANRSQYALLLGGPRPSGRLRLFMASGLRSVCWPELSDRSFRWRASVVIRIECCSSIVGEAPNWTWTSPRRLWARGQLSETCGRPGTRAARSRPSVR
jgi:hypothetical protein